MSENTQPEESEDMRAAPATVAQDSLTRATNESPPPAPKAKGRAVALFALLVAGIAVAGVGYEYWRGVLRDTRVDTVAGSVRKTRETAGQALRLGRETAAQLDSMALEQARHRQALDEARGALAEAVANTRHRAPPDARLWRLAEAEYLLRIAGHRLAMERDASAARALLMRADETLAELGDFAFHEVRALLAEDIAALAVYRGADVQGVFLRLEAMRESLGDLPLRLPEYVAAPPKASHQPDEEEAAASLWDALVARLGELVRFRRHDPRGMRPLLPPTQADYLEQHLRLSVDRAQLAALRREQALFDASLATMAEWLDAHLDPDNHSVRHLRAEIAALREAQLAAPLVDVSRPLRRFMELRRDFPQPDGEADNRPESQASTKAKAPADGARAGDS